MKENNFLVQKWINKSQKLAIQLTSVGLNIYYNQKSWWKQILCLKNVSSGRRLDSFFHQTSKTTTNTWR